MATDPTTAIYDEQVRAAWARRKLSDGTKLDLGSTDHEQSFKVTLTGVWPVPTKEEGWQRCTDGSSRRYTIAELAGC